MSAAQFSSAESHGVFLGLTPTLLRLAANGKGMVVIARHCYCSPDWSFVSVIFHEAGHAAVATRWYGEPTQLTLTSPTAGRCVLTRAGYHSPEMLRMFALAGAVAQKLAAYGLHEDDAAVELAVPGFLSTADRILAGEFTAADVRRCAEVVRSCWPDVVALANLQYGTYAAEWGAT